MLRANPVVDVAAFRRIRAELIGAGMAPGPAEAEALTRMSNARSHVRSAVLRAGVHKQGDARLAEIAEAMAEARELVGVDILKVLP